MQPSPLLHLGAVTVDLEGHVVRAPDGEDALTPLEATFMAFLVAHRGETVSRERLLEHVWDYSARTVTRAVDHTVSRLRKKIEVDPSHPRWITSVRGAGYRLEAAGTAVQPPPSAGHPPSGALGTFFGRADALASLTRTRSSAERLITVQGPPGVGKTRLCREHVRSLPPSARAIAWLSGARDLDDTLVAVAKSLDVVLPFDPDPSARIERLGHILRQRGPFLLVLDNAEHRLAEVREAVRVWLAAAAELHIVVTSRHRLGMSREEVLKLGPLDTPEAVALMVYRARQVRWDFQPGVGDLETLARISVEQLDGLPLALELAASRLAVLDPAGLERRLADRFTVLKGKRSDTQWTSLEAAIRWSWDLLTPPEQATLAQATVFVGDFDLAAAEEVIEPPDGWVPDLMGELVDHALIDRDAAEPPRFRLLQSVRELALSLGDPGDASIRHRAWCAEQAATLSRGEFGQAAMKAIHRLGRMSGDLLAAHRDAIRAGDAAAAVPLVGALTRIAMRRGTEPECVPWLQATLSLLTEGEAAWVELGWMYAVALARSHRERDALDVLQRAEAHPSEPGLLGDVLTAHAMILGQSGQLERSRQVGARALDTVRAAGDLQAEGVVLQNLAVFETSRGSIVDAAGLAERAREIAVKVGDVELQVASLQAQSNIAMVSGATAQALTYAERALPLARSHDLRSFESTLAVTVARLHLDLGRIHESLRHFEEAVASAERVGHIEGAFIGRLHQSVALIDAGRLDEADAVLHVLEHESGPVPPPAAGMIALRHAMVAHARHDAEQAEHRVRAALEQTRTTSASMPRTRAQAATLLAILVARQGDDAQAESLRAEVAEVLGSREDPFEADMVAVAQAAVLHAREVRLRMQADALQRERDDVIAGLSHAHRDIHRLLRCLPG